MKKICFAFLFSASVFAMEKKRDVYTPEYRFHYAMVYAKAILMKTPGRRWSSGLQKLLEDEENRCVRAGVKCARVAAIQDVLDGKPNKFEKKP